MREILFRGKRTDNGEWVEGIYLDNNNIGVFHEDTEDRDCYVEIFQVDPQTIGQYTGLTDKNGKRIFEGDILKLLSSKRYKVYFDRSEARFQMTGYDDEHAFYKCVSFCEIIGNIHDNPELLEVKNE